MEAEVKTSKLIVISMTEKEAVLLRVMIQNPPCYPLEEPKEEAELRRKLWDALTNAVGTQDY